MRQKESAIEIKVGALVLFSLALLAGFVLILGDIGFDDGTEVYVEYQDIGGLKPGASVKQGGIEIGSVSAIEFRGGEPSSTTGEPIWARVTLSIEGDHLDGIRVDSKFYITTEGVLGEKFVSIDTVNPAAATVDPGHVFRGVDPMRLEKVFAKVSKSLDSFNQLLNRDDLPIGDLLRHIDDLVVHTDEIIVENRPQIKKILGSVDTLITTAEATVEENRIPLNNLLVHADELAVDARVAVAEFRRVIAVVKRLAEKLDLNFGPVIDNVVAAASAIEDVAQTVLRISTDAEPKVASILDDAGVAMGDVRTATGQVAEITDYIYQGQGTIGLLIRDEEIFDNLREMLRELKRRPWKMVWKE